MRYMQSRLAKDKRDRVYRFYVTDSLKAIGNLDVRYYDFVKEEKTETRTADEIISDLKAKLRAIERGE